MRIAKRIAASGVASRREAEAMILSGRVAVRGKTLASPAYNVQECDAEEAAAITLDGHPLPQALPLELYLFHKPREVLTARIDRSQRVCLPDLLPPSLARLKPVGRLDFLSEGLLLLTTSGELARWCELPKNALQRRYRMRLHGSQDEKARARLEKLKQGIEIEGIRYRPLHVVFPKAPSFFKNSRFKDSGFKGSGKKFFNASHAPSDETRANFWIEASLREGKNRELRKIMQTLGYKVSRLIRTHYGPFALKGLARGEHKRVPEKELRALLGEKFLTF